MREKVEFNVYRKDVKNPDLLEDMRGAPGETIEEVMDAIKEYEKEGRSKQGGWVIIKTTTEYFEINN